LGWAGEVEQAWRASLQSSGRTLNPIGAERSMNFAEITQRETLTTRAPGIGLDMVGVMAEELERVAREIWRGGHFREGKARQTERSLRRGSGISPALLKITCGYIVSETTR